MPGPFCLKLLVTSYPTVRCPKPMTRSLKTDAGNGGSRSAYPQRDAALGTVCMALALASAVLLMRAVSLL